MPAGISQGGNIFDRHPVFTLLATVSLLLTILDGACATVFMKPQLRIFSGVYHHGLRPSVRETVTWGERQITIITNSLGCRDASTRRVPQRTSKHRIIFIGDSFTEGVGCPYERTFVGLIDKALSHEMYDVINAGVTSYSPKLYYLRIKYLLETEHVIANELYVFVDLSDIQDEVTYEAYVPGSSWPTLPDVGRDIDHFIVDHSVLYRYLFRSGVAQILTSTIAHRNGITGFGSFSKEYYDKRGRWPFDNTVYDEYGRKGIVLALQNMERLHELCKQNHLALHIAVYPWIEEIRRRNLNSKQVVLWEQFCRERDIDFLNYYPEFINGDPLEEVVSRNFIPGDVHWSEAGHRVVADKWLRGFGRPVVGGSYPKSVKGVRGL